jgi:hypothetical protein
MVVSLFYFGTMVHTNICDSIFPFSLKWNVSFDHDSIEEKPPQNACNPYAIPISETPCSQQHVQKLKGRRSSLVHLKDFFECLPYFILAAVDTVHIDNVL